MEDENIFKHRNIFVQIVLFFITIGIYGIYWIVITNKNMKKNYSNVPNHLTLIVIIFTLIGIIVGSLILKKYFFIMQIYFFQVLIGLILILLILYFYYVFKYLNASEKITNNLIRKYLAFFLLIFFFPIGIIYIQTKYNKIQNNHYYNFENTISEHEKISKNYINKYKLTHSKDSIKEGLKIWGLSEKEVKNYLDKYYYNK